MNECLHDTWVPGACEGQKEGIRSPGTGVTGRCEPQCRCWEWNPGPPEGQPVLFTVEPPLQPHRWSYFLILLVFYTLLLAISKSFNISVMLSICSGMWIPCLLLGLSPGGLFFPGSEIAKPLPVSPLQSRVQCYSPVLDTLYSSAGIPSLFLSYFDFQSYLICSLLWVT